MLRDSEISMNPNPLVRSLRKPSAEFTKYDIINYIEEQGIKMLNFRYVAEDGKLKTLNFVVNSKYHLETLLSTGERVDGSSLFSFIEAGKSDLYVIPRFKTAYLNPFTEVPTLDVLCGYYTAEGQPLASAPENILHKAHEMFKRETGFTLKAMGELEYYVVSAKGHLYPERDQKGYHSSPPFTNWDKLRTEAMVLIAQCGGQIKYGHSEVGNFSTDNEEFEQHEIEFLPVDLEDAADQLVVAKWILRMLGNKYGVNISFAPKITVGKAGSGLHIHMALHKDGENMMIEKGKLSNNARKLIAGLLDNAMALTAFGNTIPTSYLRLVPHQEAPTNICWGDTNRSSLVRVPLGWVAETSMIKNANPQETSEIPYIPGKQTVELRSPDGSADVYLLLAGIAVSGAYGLTQLENPLEMAEKLYVSVNIFREENKARQNQLQHLPISCYESADCLEDKRHIFEANGIFPAGTIDRIIDQLKAFEDKDLSHKLYGDNKAIRELVDKHLHCM
ncbi:MAG TPA: glutamine synthetase [Bacteroidales bacterium]|nr:glutamine synthetase [Bacteroidales bacterium]